MRLTVGAELGHFKVGPCLGMGGMGEVYQAHDTTLGRDVAVKVLPEALTRSIDRLERFGREARMLAALNHPGIAAVYSLERIGALQLLVMELVLGRTVART
jgi:serine/threonine protein kinase